MPMIKPREVWFPSWFTETLDTQRRIVKRIRRKIGKSRALGCKERTAALEEIYRREWNKYTTGRRREQTRTWRKFTTEERNEKPWGSAYRWCKEGANTISRGVLSTLRKGSGESTVGLVDTLELLQKTLISPDSIEGETGGHKRIREETGVKFGESEERLGRRVGKQPSRGIFSRGGKEGNTANGKG